MQIPAAASVGCLTQTLPIAQMAHNGTAGCQWEAASLPPKRTQGWPSPPFRKVAHRKVTAKQHDEGSDNDNTLFYHDAMCPYVNSLTLTVLRGRSADAHVAGDRDRGSPRCWLPVEAPPCAGEREQLRLGRRRLLCLLP